MTNNELLLQAAEALLDAEYIFDCRAGLGESVFDPEQNTNVARVKQAVAALKAAGIINEEEES